jgi:hypothetical protein
MKRSVLIAVLVFPLLTLVFWFYWGTVRMRNMSNDSPKKTVEERLQQFGPQTRARLKTFFDAAHVSYPPARLTLVGLKEEKTLEVYAAGINQTLTFIHSYPVLAASGDIGPKLKEGDRQVPEGLYSIESLNPNSAYHLSLRINYPNTFDRHHAQAEGRSNLGGDIMIHGGAVSIGCLAMGDDAAQDLFVLAADTGITNINVILSPVDFRKVKTVPPSDKLPAWTDALYQSIKSNLNELPPAK